MVNVKASRTFHGTGPVTPRQEELSIEYSMPTDGNGFRLQLDGDGDDYQYMHCQLPRLELNGTYSYGDPYNNYLTVYPIDSHNTEFVSVGQLTLNGKAYDRVVEIRASLEFDCRPNEQLLRTIFLAEGFGLVAFITFDGTSFYRSN